MQFVLSSLLLQPCGAYVAVLRDDRGWSKSELADATGNYRAGFTVVALLAGLGSVFFLLAKRPERPA